MALSSASVATSPLAFGMVAAVPPSADPAEPAGAGGWATFTELPAPLGSLPSLWEPFVCAPLELASLQLSQE